MATRSVGLVPLAFALVAVMSFAVGCSEQGAAERLPEDSPVLVETSASSVTFQNRAGLPLTDVSITILPYGPLEFSKTFPRFENSERREIPFNQFTSRDGASYNARLYKAKSVRVRAKDSVGKSYDVEVAWR